jgi:hypothetical protein
MVPTPLPQAAVKPKAANAKSAALRRVNVNIVFACLGRCMRRLLDLPGCPGLSQV